MQMNDNPPQIEARSHGHMMQVRFGQPLVGRVPQHLRERTLDARTKGILVGCVAPLAARAGRHAPLGA